MKKPESISRPLYDVNVIEMLGDKRLIGFLTNESKVRSFFEHASVGEFLALINEFNGLIRGLPKEEWGITDKPMQISGSMESETIFPISEKDRQPLIEQLHDALRQMSQAGRSMEDLGIATAVVLNEIHPWEDANGRTSRVLYALMVEKQVDFEKRIKDLLSEDGSDLLITDARALTKYLLSILKKKHDVYFSNLFADIPTNQFAFQFDDKFLRSSLNKLFTAESHGDFMVAVSEFLKSLGGDHNALYREYPGDRRVFLFDKLCPLLTKENAERIIEFVFKIKREKIELLIDCIKNPSREEYRLFLEDGGKTNFLELLKNRVIRSSV